MSIARFAKTGASLMGGQGIMVATQLLLPPLFLRRYGVVSYGEWLTLSAAAQYLGTLNFGLHNFANNQVTIHYNRGEMDEVNTIQATSFAILLAIVGVVAALTGLVFLLPVSQWLHLTMTSLAAATTVYLLGLQLLTRMAFGFLQGGFLVVGAFHRGANWNNGLSIAGLAVSTVLVMMGSSFTAIALGQFLSALLFLVLVGLDLRVKAGVAFPKLRYARRARVMEILKPSGYFGMLFSASFLVYQLPVVIMQRLLGPTNVVVFSISRTVFSMSRQALTAISTALGPEIVELYGQNKWSELLRLYDLSERAVFALVPVVTFATFLASPLLMAVWLHKPLYELDVCLLLALISAAAGIKEHKYQFQTSVNQHTQMARFLFFSYIAMIVCMIPGVSWFGIRAFLLLWLFTESAQIIYTVHLNRRLFADFAKVDIGPMYRMGAVLALGALACWFIAHAVNHRPALVQITAVAAFSICLLAIEYPLFQLAELRQSLVQRFFPKRHTAVGLAA